MKNLIIILLFFLVIPATAQQDTIVVRDYSKIFITIDNSGEIEPVTDYSQVRKAGFFLSKIEEEGMLRICSKNELFVWVDGRLAFSVEGCLLYEHEKLFSLGRKDTIFVSLSSQEKFENLKCEHVIFEELQVLKDEVSEPRQTRDIFREFNTISFILLIAGYAVYAASFAGRLQFFIRRTFSLKASAYQFINTAFLGRANVFMALLLCLTVSFEIIYVNQKVDLQLFTEPATLTGYFNVWLIVTFWMIAFFIAKRILIQIVAGLFKMKKLRDWQLFDLVNFAGYFVLVLFIVILWDFVLKGSNESWIGAWFSYYFVAILLLFELWFIIKFVINSSYQKLLIISYLCATELIPSILIMVWFFK